MSFGIPDHFDDRSPTAMGELADDLRTNQAILPVGLSEPKLRRVMYTPTEKLHVDEGNVRDQWVHVQAQIEFNNEVESE